ncbi:MAG: CHAT domain-containing protein [Cyanobacteria bacterium P01_B01_bin.77]
MTRHALFLNIADYCDLNLPPLKSALAWALIQQLEAVGDFQTLARLPATHQEASPFAKDLGQALRQFLLNQAQGQDGLIYISGYGITVEDSLGEQQGFLLPPEGEIICENGTIIGQRHGISLDSLNGLIRKSSLKRLIVLWDCNHHHLGLTQEAIETSLTVFNEKPDYCLMANAMAPTAAPLESGIFSQTLSQLLLPGQVTGAIDCDLLFEMLNNPLHTLELTPIQLGASSLAVVIDPGAPPAPPPATNNIFNISDSTLTNVSASGNIYYTEAASPAPPSAGANEITRGKQRKILMLAANPKDTDQLRLGAESREILAGLERSQYRDQFDLITRFSQRPNDLRRALLDIKPDIVHFSGHGGGAHGLVLENDAGKMQFVSTASLVRLFKFFSHTIECVVLNACYSEEQATAIHEYIDCVVGMNRAVGDRSAIKFAIGFYDALGAGYSYEDAFEMGLIAIDVDRLKGLDIPRLKLREHT